MGGRTEAYVDTSALIAFLDRSDSYHELFARLFADPPPLITSPLVIAEGHAWFLRRYDRTRAMQFMDFAQNLSALSVKAVGKRELSSAREMLARFPDQDLTIADAVGLDFMEALKIRVCWSTDRQLGFTGVPLVIHEI